MGDAREQLAGFRIIKEKGRAFRIERGDDQFDKSRQLMIEGQLTGHSVGDFDQQQQAPYRFVRAIDDGCVPGGERGKQRLGYVSIRFVGDHRPKGFGAALHFKSRFLRSEPIPSVDADCDNSLTLACVANNAFGQ
ncbi:MAG TPA: hypothetical protein VMS01_14460 [Stellaceae bacterium]|nr:hypothetical protein [Stellaceae bacterium]